MRKRGSAISGRVQWFSQTHELEQSCLECLVNAAGRAALNREEWGEWTLDAWDRLQFMPYAPDVD